MGVLASRMTMLVLALIACSAAVAAGNEEGFVSMFNGKDLKDWEGAPGYWSVEDGAITGETSKKHPLDYPTYIFWRGGKPADFELRANFRFRSAWGNSGINFRSQELPKWDVKGYQADMDTGTTCIGTVYEVNQREVMTACGQKVVIDENGNREVTTFAKAADLLKVYKPHQWNEYVIIARGPEILLKVNGALMADLVDHQKGKAAAAGLITLQLHPGTPMKVQFKDLRIKYLK